VFNDWLPFLIYGLFALMIPATMVIGSFVFAQRPSHRTRARTIPFESGVSEGVPKKQRFTVSFYLTAMLFILFDIEIVFLYPLAVILHLLGWFGTTGKKVGQFYWVHEMHCVSENELYTGEAQNWRVQRITMRPAPRTASK